MKNNHIGLFALGIVMGGVIMFAMLGLSQFQERPHADPLASLTSASDHLPHLIAIEPTGARRKMTPTSVAATRTGEPSQGPVLAQKTISPTPTPLALLNGQRPEIIGTSVGGRPLEVYTFGNGEHRRMIVAGIHGGDEWNTITLANQLIVYLNQNPGEIPEDITLYILPNLNPDGEARAHNKYGRLNGNGVDLNRNFPENWKSNWERAGCWNYLPSSGGSGPGSEAETEALMDFISARAIEALISYHSAALGIFPGGLPWTKDSVRLAQAIADVSSYRFPPLDTGCTYSGTLADYAVSKGIAAVDLELTNHYDTDFEQNLKILNVLMNFVP